MKMTSMIINIAKCDTIRIDITYNNGNKVSMIYKDEAQRDDAFIKLTKDMNG